MSGANISAEQESYNAIRTAVRNLQTHLQTLNAKVKVEVNTAGSAKATQALTDFDTALASVGGKVTQNELDALSAVNRAGAAMLN